MNGLVLYDDFADKCFDLDPFISLVTKICVLGI